MAKLQSTASMGKALADYHRAGEETRRQQEAERAEIRASRPAVKRAADIAKDQHHDGASEIEYVDRGPVRALSRDGLLWLISKGRLPTELRAAAERYRRDYAVVHGGQLRSCIDGAIGGGDSDPIDRIVTATRALEKVRDEAFKHDPTFIWIMDEVAGKGTTLRSLAQGDDYQATVLEVEFRCACRLLARHYGRSGGG